MKVILLKNRIIHLLLSFSLIGGLLAFIPISTVHAKEITIIGADQPVVTTNSGENVTDQNNLSRWQSYNVTYQWSIPNEQNIQSGDTATFIIPNNIQVLYPTSFNIKDKEENIIGTFSIKPGEKFGILTFNDYYSNHSEQNISGTLSFWGNGRSDTVYKDWILNKVGWVNEENKPTWCIAYNPSGQILHNVTIKDTLLGNQTLDIDSISIQYGYFDENNQFHPEGVLPNNEYHLETRNDGFDLTINELNKPIQISYTSTVQNSTDTIVNNIVQGSASEIGEITNSASVSIGGNGSVSGDKPTDSTTTTNSSTESTDSTTTTNNSTELTDSTTTTSSSIESTDSTATTSSSTHDKNIIIITDHNNQFQGHQNTPVSNLPLKPGHEYSTSNGEEIRLYDDKIQKKDKTGKWENIDGSTTLSQLPQTRSKKEFIFICIGFFLITISIISGIYIFRRTKNYI